MERTEGTEGAFRERGWSVLGGVFRRNREGREGREGEGDAAIVGLCDVGWLRDLFATVTLARSRGG